MKILKVPRPFESSRSSLTAVACVVMFFLGVNAVSGEEKDGFLSENLATRLSGIQSQYLKGEIQASIEQLKTLIKEVPLYLPAYSQLSEYLLVVGDRKASVTLLKEAGEKAAPQAKAAWKRRAQVASRQFRNHESLKVYQSAVQDLTVLKFKDAKQKLESILTQESDHIEILTRLGQIAVFLDEPAQAATYLESAYRLNPYEQEIWVWLARAYFLDKQYKKSEMIFQKINLLAANSSEYASLSWFDFLLSQKSKKAALDFIEKHLEKNPEHVRALVKGADLRSSLFLKDHNAQWQSRKDLQLALSRLEDYIQSSNQGLIESPLGINTLKGDELKQQIEESLKQVENRAESSEDASTKSVGET